MFCRSYVPYVAENKMSQRNNTTVMNVEYAGCCYATTIKDAHHCVERAMHHNCAVCFEFLFESTKKITVLPCGHTIHLECVKEMELHRSNDDLSFSLRLPDILALSALSPSVICRTCGESLMKRCGYYVTIMGNVLKCDFTLSRTNAWSATLTILDKFKEAHARLSFRVGEIKQRMEVVDTFIDKSLHYVIEQDYNSREEEDEVDAGDYSTWVQLVVVDFVQNELGSKSVGLEMIG
ncbi:hypothetical protein DH2020_020748 [Rehmannia glutinosa]|uniref:RING-type domain-containing protein n=1 Tax=Rehmannia glutinosa TaxID=99300 RepID=A0ABR0W2T7_REHGL